MQKNVFLLGRRPYNVINVYISAFDIYVAPYDPQVSQHVTPLKVLEAMSCGRPVVTTNAGDIPLVIENNIDGLITEFDVQPLFECIYRLAQAHSERNFLGTNARRKIVAKYSWQQITKITYNAILSELKES